MGALLIIGLIVGGIVLYKFVINPYLDKRTEQFLQSPGGAAKINAIGAELKAKQSGYAFGGYY